MTPSHWFITLSRDPLFLYKKAPSHFMFQSLDDPVISPEAQPPLAKTSSHAFLECTWFLHIFRSLLHVPPLTLTLHRACVKEDMEHSSKGNGTHQMELIKKEHLLKEHSSSKWNRTTTKRNSSKGTLIIE